MDALRRMLCCVLTSLVFEACTKSEQPTSIVASRLKGTIRGAIAGSVWYVPPSGDQVSLRDFDVELRRASKTVQRAKSDAYGIFHFRDVAYGQYQVCWNAQGGWASGCGPKKAHVGVRAEALGELHISADPAKGSVAFGRVTLADGIAAVEIDPLFAVETYPQVSVESGTATQANAEGVFALAGIPSGAKSITVRYETSVVTSPVAVGRRMVVRIANHSPVATTAIVQANPGEMLTLKPRATDVDHDSLTYRWNVGGTSVTPSADGSAQWKAPARSGRYLAYVLANDGKGGFARTAMVINVATAGQPCPKPTNTYTCPPTGAPGVPCDQGRFLRIRGNDLPTATAYYLAVDPNSSRRTLQDWWKVAGFQPDGSGGVHASYTNDNDLGFGRDMHMIKTQFGVFAYVTNYANQCRLQDPANAQIAKKADPKDVVATVCMEYASPSYNGPQSPGSGSPIVKFFVYDDNNKRSEQAALDPTGLVPIPSLCLNCHGGSNFVTPASGQPAIIDLNARFLPFDLATFQYEPPNTPDYKAFHELNDLVKGTMPATSPIAELIDGWYAAGGDKPDLAFVPLGDWRSSDGKKKLYDRVVGRSCRTCHAAFDLTGSSTWSTYAEFKGSVGGIKSRVNSGNMPHAAVTFMNFWTTNFWKDGTGQAVLKCFTDGPDDTAMETCLAKIR
jgi:hypothetical protein